MKIQLLTGGTIDVTEDMDGWIITSESATVAGADDVQLRRGDQSSERRHKMKGLQRDYLRRRLDQPTRYDFQWRNFWGSYFQTAAILFCTSVFVLALYVNLFAE